MFTQISWGNYITIISFILAGYYMVIVFLYYKDELLAFFSQKKLKQDHEIHLSHVESLSDEVKAFFSEAERKKMNKDEILKSLTLLLTKYPVLKDAISQGSVVNLILKESEANCSILLKRADLGELWK